VVRVLGIPAVLVVALIGIYLYAQDAKSNGPTSAAGQQAISQAQSSVAATNFARADAAMQAYYTQTGTYAGATLRSARASSSPEPTRTRTASRPGTSMRMGRAASPNPAAARASLS
jgi:hypothetical protein